MNPIILNATIGLGCALLGLLAALYVKDKARDVVQTEFANLISSSLSTFKNQMLNEISDKLRDYKRSAEVDLSIKEHERRLDALEERMGLIDEIAEDTKAIKAFLKTNGC